MLKTPAICLLALSTIGTFISCKETPKPINNANPTVDSAAATVEVVPRRERVLTAAEQKALTPDMVIESLKKGNQRFARNEVTARDHSAMVRNASLAQFPKAVILSCLDSRIPVEDVFDKGIGDLFVARVAGNFANEDILGSMEYGCKVSGARLILVLGHESCGAIKSAIDKVELGNITAMLARIRPAIEQSQHFNGEKNSSNDAFVEYVAKNNVTNTINEILLRSPILKEMADKGEIKVVGAYYDLKTGEVTFL